MAWFRPNSISRDGIKALLFEQKECPLVLRYTVKSGETLASIALDFRTTTDALKAANPSLQGQEPVQNEVIIIPGLPDPHTIYRISVSISRKRLVLFSGS